MTYDIKRKILAILGLVLSFIILPFVFIGKVFEAMQSGVVWFSEKVLKKPFFAGHWERWQKDKIATRQKLCAHLNGQKLVLYEQDEFFLYAKVTRNAGKTLTDEWLEICLGLLEASFFALNLYSIDEKLHHLYYEIGEKKMTFILNELPSILTQTELVDMMYLFESECFKTHKALVNAANFLQSFGFDTQEICKYNVSASKYDNQSTAQQISSIKEHLQGVQAMLAEKTVWLDELLARQDDFKKLSKDEQKAVSALFDEMKKIYALITSDFARGGAWIDTQTPVDKAQIHCKPSDESKKTKSSKQNDIWLDKLIAWADEREIALKDFPRDKDKLRNVKKLYLSHYGLTALPDEFENLQQVEILRLNGNKFKEFPKVLCNFTKLKELVLSGCDLISLPDEFANLQSLEELHLIGDKFKEFPKVLCKLTNLKNLNLELCGLESLPNELANLQKLENLALKNNKFTKFPRAVCELTNLKELHLDFCKLTALPDELANLQKLENLYLTDNKLTQFPQVLCKLVNVKELHLGSCELATLPDELEALQKLEWLDLDRNEFKEFPKVICKLTNLHTLNLIYCKLSSLPDELANLQQLSILNLFGNPFKKKPSVLEKLKVSKHFLGA